MEAKEVLITIKAMLENNLEELKKAKDDSFVDGEITAYTECLEIIQDFDKEKEIQFDYDIEEKFPLKHIKQ